MLTPLLVVTPHPSFGELIRQSLDDTGSYRVRVVNSRADALAAAREDKPAMAFLDFDLGQQDTISIGKGLRRTQPEISLVVIAADGELPASLEEIRPWQVLSKPFYLPDLLRIVGEPAAEQEEGVDSKPQQGDVTWLEDVNKAAQHLTRLTLESSAQAALITRENNLWAYAGGLSHEAANEIAAAIARYWDTQKESDLLRFIRLESTRAEHMLYATRLRPGIIMALVFDAETPFSTIRMQANRLAQALSISPDESPAPAPVAISPPPQAEPIEPDEALDDLMAGEDEDGVDIPSISSILYDVPPPRPSVPEEKPVAASAPPAKRPPRAEEKEEDEAEIEYPALDSYPSAATQRSTAFSLESSPAVPLNALIYAERKPETLDETHRSSSGPEGLGATAPSKAQRPSTPIRPPSEDELAETRPSSAKEEGARRVVFEPPSPGLYNLTYACLLVPRVSGHYLAGDLAQYLSEWMQEICVAFGWRLEFLTVRPEYLQWVVNVPPSSSPGYLMRIVRQQTSERIFAHFPRLKQENPSGDFWAPGYLIMGGDRPHPPQLVKDYISQTRQRQGMLRPRSRR